VWNVGIGDKTGVKVPFVVTNTILDRPILGYNVIAHFFQDNHACNLQSIFQDRDAKTVRTLASLVAERERDDIGVVAAACTRPRKMQDREVFCPPRGSHLSTLTEMMG
jgi:hypothetical protein